MRRKNLAIAILLSAAVALTGCTSGGTATPPPQLVPAAGLQAGAAEPPVYAKDRTDTLSKLLPVAANVFAPLSAALRRDYEGEGDGSGSPNTKLKDDFHIESIASDGADGFKVTYVHEEKEPVDVHFTKERYGTAESGSGKSYSLPFTDGGWEYIRLWHYAGSFDDGPSNQGSGRYRYFDVLGFKYRDPDLRDEGIILEDRVYMTFGARTETLPAGQAYYKGHMRADIYEAHNFKYKHLNGALSLRADFGYGTLSGRVSQIRLPEQASGLGGTGDIITYPTTYFEITDAEILDGRFTAKLEGKDSDENAVMDDQSVLGYVGDILGEFYGPDAEEVGGVLNGSRDADGDGSPDTVMHGYIGGSLFPHLISDSPWRVLSTAVKRDRPNAGQTPPDPSGTVTPSAARVTSVASDAAGGFTLAYTIDGVEKTVALESEDFGKSAAAGGQNFFDITGDIRFTLWNTREGGGLRGAPQYEYFDINGWAAGTYAENDQWTAFDRGFVIYGNQTETMPSSGTATYAGRMRADRWRADRPSRERSRYRGDLALTANFADATITGGVTDVIDERNDNSPVPSVTFSNGSIQNNTLSADFSGLGGFTGKVEGAFFGPSAEEVGGVLEGTRTGGDLLVGYIGGKKQ